jgi:DNA (cytosine-5)-methyltransferase 1
LTGRAPPDDRFALAPEGYFVRARQPRAPRAVLEKRSTSNVDLHPRQHLWQPRTAVSLCAGGGGVELGLGLACPGLVTVCYVEIEARAAAVLVERMEEGALAPAPVWTDLRTFDGRPWRGAVDLVAAGFPCQNVSHLGDKLGVVDGGKSSLWAHVARVVREVRPRVVFLENVADLTVRGIDTVLGDMACLGFDAEWCVLSAAEIGGPHIRERWFALAYANGEQGGPGLPDARAVAREDRLGGGEGGIDAPDLLPHDGAPGGTPSGIRRVDDGVAPRVDGPGGPGIRGDEGGELEDAPF